MATVNAVLELATTSLAIVLALAITVAAVAFTRAPLTRLLQRLVGDKAVAEAGTRLVLFLLALHGLRALLGYLPATPAARPFDGLLDMLLGMAGVVQWAAGVLALLYVGYSLQARRGGGKGEA